MYNILQSYYLYDKYTSQMDELLKVFMNTLYIPVILFSGMRGSTPLDVAAASCIDNNELALALQEQDLEMVKHNALY